ncbi:MAG: ABC transporter permease [Candidatus Heimdallarchaeaceae archaeon]
MMRIMVKKIFREIWRNKFRSLSIIIVVTVSLALLVGLRSGNPILFDTYDLNMKEFNVADGTFTFSEPIDEGNITAIQNNQTLLSEAKIDLIEGRILYLTEITYKGEKFKAVVIGIKYPNSLNQLVIEEKADDITDENKILDSDTSCLIETRFAGHNLDIIGQDVQLNDILTLNFQGTDVNFTVKGIAQDSYYTYLVDEVSKMPLLGSLAVVWINIDRAQELLGLGATEVNQVLFTVQERFDKDMILSATDELTDYFTTNNISPSSIKFVIYDETDEYKMFISDAGAVDKTGTIFGLIGLIICTVIILNTISKLVNAQRKNIGLFLAMGSKKREIIFHYVGITFVLSTIGVVLGIPFALLLAIGMAKMVMRMYGFHLIAMSLPLKEFIIGAVVTLSVCLLSSVLSAWPITRASPREAMTVAFTRIKVVGKTFAEKLFGWIPLFRSSIHMIVPLREVFLKKKKSLITLLALTTSMIFLVNSFAMVYNIVDVMMANFDEYNTYDVQVTLKNPVPINKVTTFMHDNSLTALKGISHYEVFINSYTKIVRDNELLSWTQIACYQENSSIRNYHIIEGDITDKTELGTHSILLGQAIASKYEINIGDKIDIGIIGNYSVEVVGIVGELIDYAVLWTFESFQESGANAYFGLPYNWINGIVFNVKDDADLKAIRKTFEDNFAIDFWTESSTARESTLALMESMLGLFSIFLGVGIGIGVLFSFQAMYMAFVDRHRDFIAFKAMGTKNKYIKRMIFWENAILSLFSLLLTVPLGYLTYRWSVDYMLEESFYMPYSIPWFTWPIILILSSLSIWLATGRLMVKVKKINLTDELRQTGVT